MGPLEIRTSTVETATLSAAVPETAGKVDWEDAFAGAKIAEVGVVLSHEYFASHMSLWKE
ncbi:MAG: hypothetical protein COV48_05900 [Elusimicrobia bacterium CG11_big_fil_rev_8_21_14_0_20_64_6]|nr:MAG: hypothetical protein COV48_05900 [Elusimicrobia bacterium CG11_big_fil_rev_8_21_14_0_20_64_6]